MERFLNALIEKAKEQSVSQPDFMQRLDNQNFGPNDSVIASTVNHPIDAANRGAKWLAQQIRTAAGLPDEYDNPNPLLSPSADQQTQAAFDIAGLAQLGSMPMAPASRGGVLGTLTGMADDIPETEFSQAHKIAQQNAVEMLGLPPDNTAMDRARAMGFFKNYYHGTVDDIDKINPNLKPSQRVHSGGKINKDVFWVTTSPEGAGHFANMAAAKQAFGDPVKALQVKGGSSGLFFDKPENISNYGEDFVQGQNIMPVTWSGLRTRYDAQDAFNNASATKRRNTIISAIQDARESGRDAVRFDGVMDPIEQDTMAVLNPKSIRSIFAAFDPAKKDSADLLASWLLPATMLGAGMMPEEQNKQALQWALTPK